jgi:hypothetical protein
LQVVDFKKESTVCLKFEQWMSFSAEAPFPDFRPPVKGQLWGEFRHKQVVVHKAVPMPEVVPFGATAEKHGCAHAWRRGKSLSQQ